jgi:hypothetical protein
MKEKTHQTQRLTKIGVLFVFAGLMNWLLGPLKPQLDVASSLTCLISVLPDLFRTPSKIPDKLLIFSNGAVFSTSLNIWRLNPVDRTQSYDSIPSRVVQ